MLLAAGEEELDVSFDSVVMVGELDDEGSLLLADWLEVWVLVVCGDSIATDETSLEMDDTGLATACGKDMVDIR